MPRKSWFLIGAGFGLAVPIFLNVIQRLGPWHVRPTAYVLFRPGSLALYAVSEHLQRTLVMQLLTLVANAAVFGALAYGLRYGFLFLMGALLTINLLSLPPSDAGSKGIFPLNSQTSSG